MTLNKEAAIGIAGAGAMGSGIAQVAATAGHRVYLYDTNEVTLKASAAALEKVMDRLVEKKKINQDDADETKRRISYETSINNFNHCSLVIEAIVEDLEIKKNFFASLEGVVDSACILATNTSSLSVASIAAACKKSERVMGIHFFNPAPLMPLVEIVAAVQSSEEIVSGARALIDSWGKLTVVAKDTPGFIVNRVARPFYGEALRILEEGIADAHSIDWAMKELGGFKMGPFELMDFIGNDINYAVTESVFKAFYYDPRYKPSFTQKRMVEAGWFGRKTGRGFYEYSDDALVIDPNVDADLELEVVSRIVAMLINEAADALYMNVASRDDIDLAMTKGTNYPKGLLSWADELGIGTCVNTLDHLYAEYGEDRYRASPLLRKMYREKTKFY